MLSPRGPILASLMIATFVVSIDSTILATAVPTIVGDLGGFAQFSWLFSAYLLAQAASVPVYGKLADTFGRRPVMITGIAIFLLGSILCALAWDMTALIAFRAVQGLGAGGILPISMTIAGDIYTVRERARVQGYLASVWAVSALAGPTLGGIFVEYLSWRWIFWIKLPLCVLAIWMLRRNYRERFERRARRRIDVGGALLLSLSIALLILGVLEGGRAWAWASWQTAACFGGGAVLLTVFALVERRVEDPVLAPWVFRSRIVTAAAMTSLLVGGLMIGIVSFVPTFVYVTTGVSPILAGLAAAGLSLGWPLSSALSGRIYLRIGFRATAMIGATIALLGSIGLVLVTLAPSMPLTAAACFVIGLGLGLVANPPLIAAQASVDLKKRGVVSATNVLARSVGSAVAVALYGAVANYVIGRATQTPPHLFKRPHSPFFSACAPRLSFSSLSHRSSRVSPLQATRFRMTERKP